MPRCAFSSARRRATAGGPPSPRHSASATRPSSGPALTEHFARRRMSTAKNREFRIEVTAAGFFDGKTDWQSADGGERMTFPDLVLRPRSAQRLIAGRVVDRGGKGVAAVTVFQPTDSPARTEAFTDDAGRFRLDGVPGGPALVFAEKAGYRFGGAVVSPGDGPVEIRLARPDEPPISIPKPVPPPLSRAEERSIALELIAPLINPARAGSLGQMGQAVVPALARVDPERVLEMLENRAVPQAANVLCQVALGQLEDDPITAVATIEADRDPAARALGFLALADALTDAQAKRRLELIDRVLAEAGRVDDKESRLRLLRHVADRWLQLGLVDRATPILREGRSIIASLPRDQFSFDAENFAEVLAVIDRRTAKTLFERKDPQNASPTDPGTIQRHRGEAAIRLAAIDPAEAEQLVPQVVANFWGAARDDFVLRICQRMARADLPRRGGSSSGSIDPPDRIRVPGPSCSPRVWRFWPPIGPRPIQPGRGRCWTRRSTDCGSSQAKSIAATIRRSRTAWRHSCPCSSRSIPIASMSSSGWRRPTARRCLSIHS